MTDTTEALPPLPEPVTEFDHPEHAWKWTGLELAWIKKRDEQWRARLDAELWRKPEAWTTQAHIHASNCGKSGLFVKNAGTVFCVPVFFGKPQPIDDHRDPT